MERNLCVIVSTFLIFMFADELGNSWMCFLSCTIWLMLKKKTMADFRYKSSKPWIIDNINLTQEFSSSIFNDFRYQLIKSLDCCRFLSIDYSRYLRSSQEKQIHEKEKFSTFAESEPLGNSKFQLNMSSLDKHFFGDKVSY